MKVFPHRLTAVIPILAWLLGCSQQSAPECRVEAAAQDRRVGNAGCLIVLNGRTLLIEHRVSGRLGFPGGTAEAGEISQCTAHRETWEETGLDVEVGAFVKRLSTDFSLYECHSDKVRLSSDRAPPLARWSRVEVSGLQWRDIDEIAEEQWRFPDQLSEVRGLDDR
ncbi:MAG: NUDIX hydrolase [Gammaproteobacteria bacterium]|jgi:8-oxo-dGTP pyrophosphatase MutT (NUDIX family)